MKNKIESTPSFLKNHADTMTIVGVNIAIAAILISMFISNSHRIDSVNARQDAQMQRIDQLYCTILDMIKEGRKVK